MTVPEITCVITAHDEGALAGISLRSFLDATAEAEQAGLRCEKLAVLDRPGDPTRAVFAGADAHDLRVIETDFGDQGRARNAAVEQARGSYVAFLDGDDLWSLNWLVAAHRLCHERPGRVIAHPEFNWFFDQQASLLIKPDERDPGFSASDFLRLNNCWDALCLAPLSAYRDHPFCKRDVRAGFAYEDWHWNCETLAAGYHHRVAQGTIIFKRRREGSRTIEASSKKTLIRPTPLLAYDWPGTGGSAQEEG